jgi:hypothetical protein
MGKIDEVRDKAKNEVATAEWSGAMTERDRERTVGDAMVLGAVSATMSIGRSLSLGAFQRLRKFIDEESFKQLGYQTVVEFLNSDHSPVTKSQYYERLNALSKEGEEVFDLLNSMDISLSNRKLLAKGEIRIDGEEVVVGREEREERIAVSDRLGVKTLIATLAEAKARGEQRIAEQERKIKRGEKDVEKYKRKLADAERRGGPTSGTPHGQALLTLVGAYANLRDEIIASRDVIEPGSESEAEFMEFKRTTMETIGNSYRELSDAFDMAVAGANESSAADLLEG